MNRIDCLPPTACLRLPYDCLPPTASLRLPRSAQRLWHALYPRVHELPFGYNANADANMSASSWAAVHVLHDLVVQRKRGWRGTGHEALVANLTREAHAAFRVSISSRREAPRATWARAAPPEAG
jgi:hypothetical protein